MKALWILPLIGVIASIALMAIFWTSADSSPKEAAIASLAVLASIVPYVFVRTVEGLASGIKKRE